MPKLQFKNILIACDHAAFPAKQSIVTYIQSTYKDLNLTDLGVHSEDRVDYPDIANDFCKKLLSGEHDGGILLCGSGIGISISANRHKGVRAALCHDHYTAKMCREHNDANVMCAGARVVGSEVLKDMVDVWLKTEFLGGRHATRVTKIDQQA